MNRRLRLTGIEGETVGDFEEVYPDQHEWRGVDLQRSRGMCIYRWEHVITRIADLIGDGHVYRLEFLPPLSGGVYVDIDRAGNTWHDHEYLAPHQYLPLMIPENVP